VDQVGSLEVGDRRVTESEFSGGLPQPVQGRRGAGVQEPAQHGAVQVAQRRRQRRLALPIQPASS
jgi:hypothetical protein